MRLFGRVDNSISRFDRAVWLTGGPWGGFDLALLINDARPFMAYGQLSVGPAVEGSFGVEPA